MFFNVHFVLLSVACLLLHYHHIFALALEHSFSHVHKSVNYTIALVHNAHGKLSEHDARSICLDPGYADIKCALAKVRIGRFHPEILASVFDRVDSQGSYISTLHVHFILTTGDSEEQYGKSVDEVLGPRPWWQVREERIKVNSYLDSGSSGSSSVSKHNSSTIILDRIHHKIEPYMKFLVATHYKSSEECDQTPMLIRSTGMVHPGWGSHFGFMYVVQYTLPYAIQSMYFPTNYHDRNSFISLPDCLNKTNLWECAFLPTTNCSHEGLVFAEGDYGKNLLKFSGQKFGSYLLEYPSRKEGLQGKFCNEDRMYNRTANCGEHAEFTPKYKQYLETLHHNYSEMSDAVPLIHPHNKEKLFVDPNPLYPFVSSFSSYKLDNVRQTSLIFDWFLRRSYLYRSRIEAMLNRFYEENNKIFSRTSTCVATHIRRGDRVLLIDKRFGEEADKINADYVIELCNNVTMNKGDNITCRLPNGRMLSGPSYCFYHDLGCDSYPLSMVSLEEIVEKASYLLKPNETKNLVVATDDPDWLRYWMKRLKTDKNSKWKDWNILYLPEPENHLPKDLNDLLSHMSEPYANYHHLRTDGGTASGTYLYASLQLMQQCKGFVGHFDSHFSFLILNLLCLRHNTNTRHVCPPYYDFRMKKYPKFLKDKYF